MVKRNADRQYEGNLRAERVKAQRTPTYRGEMVHYRDDYGTTMDDQQYQSSEEKRKAFENAMFKAQGKVDEGNAQLTSERNELNTQRGMLNTATNQVNSAYKEALKRINTAKSRVPTYDKWINTQSFVDVYSGGNFEARYKLAQAAVGNFWNSVDAYNKSHKNDMDVRGSGNGLKIDVHGYGKEMHEQLGAAQELNRKAFEVERNRALGEVQKAEQSLMSQMGVARDKLNKYSSDIQNYQGAIDRGQALVTASQNSITAQRKERKTFLNGIRNRYAQRLNRIREAILEMAAKGGK